MASKGSRSSAPLSYAATGVDTEGADASVRTLARWVNATFGFNAARPILPLGYYANVIGVTPDLGIAISTDGVGTKILIAQELAKYDTVGIDCVAMNANDILCVGARPISMVDYVAVERADPTFLADIAKGLHDGAQAAGISIPGGEIAQVRELLHAGPRGFGFDLVGTCIGTVHPEQLLIGQDVRPGDLVVGIASSGIHSNGYTLARRALLERAELHLGDHVSELGRTLGEELLEPTRIYVQPVLDMMDEALRLKALLHITGDGVLNLSRVHAHVGFVIDRPFAPPPIFALIQRAGGIDDAEMYRVYNMGMGFAVVVDPRDAARVIAIAEQHRERAAVVGYAVADAERRVWLPAQRLVSEDKHLRLAAEPTPPCPT